MSYVLTLLLRQHNNMWQTGSAFRRAYHWFKSIIAQVAEQDEMNVK